MKNFNINMGKLIRFKRRSGNITQEELCNDLGISQGQLSKVERGIQELGAFNFVKITKKLKISLDKVNKFI